MTEPSTEAGLTMARKVQIVWIVYLVSLVTGGLAAVVGVVLAYVWRGDASGDAFAETHFRRQIKTFWITLAITVVGAVLALVLVGFAVLFAATVYLLVMSLIGLLKALDGKPWS
jgi:uncharacterized membrane protein